MFQLEPHAGQHMKERFNSLIEMNPIRVMQLLEAFQFGIAYFFFAFLSGSFLDTLFPLPDEMKETNEMLIEVLLQSLLFIIAVFYIRKLVKIMPFVFYIPGTKYRPYEISEYSGEMMIGLVLIATQFGLLKKIDILSRRFYQYMLDKEKSIDL